MIDFTNLQIFIYGVLFIYILIIVIDVLINKKN